MTVFTLLLSLLLPLAATSQQQSARVYLHPQPLGLHSTPHLSPSQAHAVLSFHLGIDRWIDIKQGGEWLDHFVRGDETDLVGGAEHGAGLVLLVQADHPEDFIAYSRPSFTIASPPPYSTFQSLLKTYSSRISSLLGSLSTFNASAPSSSSPNRILDIFDLEPTQQVETFKAGMAQLDRYASWVDDGGRTGGAIDVGGLDGLRKGTEAYDTGAQLLNAALSIPALAGHKYALIVLPSTLPTTNAFTGQSALSSSVCYTSNSTCSSSTSNCSGHGNCVQTKKAGQTCYVCKCGRAPEYDGGRNVSWAGATCEKVDISGSFTLLIGSTVFLIVVAVASVMLLYGVGTEALPNTLIGAAPSVNKRE